MGEVTISYAQNREDIFLFAFFEDEEKGLYVDVGAYHPVKDSVTQFFYKRGWKGINIEPQRYFFDLLLKHRKRDVNLNIGISNKPGRSMLRSYYSKGLSTFSQDMKKLYRESSDPYTQNFIDAEVKLDTLSNIFAKHKVHSIQFMKIDVEGLEYEVIESNNWTKYRPEVLCIESNHIIKDWHPLLSKYQYKFAFFDGLNEYYVSNEATHRMILFKKRYPELLIEAPIISNDWHKIIRKTSNKFNRSQAKLHEQTKLINQLQKKIQQKEKNLNDPKFLLVRALRILFKRLP